MLLTDMSNHRVKHEGEPEKGKSRTKPNLFHEAVPETSDNGMDDNVAEQAAATSFYNEAATSFYNEALSSVQFLEESSAESDVDGLAERIEQMNAQKRRMKQLEHKRTVEALIAERLQKIEQEAQIEREISERERMLQQYRDDVVEQERQRLLQEHAGPLAGYLPKVCFNSLANNIGSFP